MRIIKFRGKHIHAFIEPNDTGIWVYGYLCNDHYINSEELMGEMLVDKDTVGQYTGLKDKNGKEIYENDIVEVTRPCIYETGKVIYKNGCFFIKVKETLLPLYECEMNNYKIKVIGNEWDNPELLEKE